MKGWLLVLLTALIGITLTLGIEHLTVDDIALQVQAQQRQALLDLLPSEGYDNQPLDHPLAIKAQTLTNSQLHGGYLATRAGDPSAVVLRLQTSGYAGPIELLIAIDRNGKVLGTKTLEQSETPGIGGYISKPGNPWMTAFKGHSHTDQRKFDQVAGATVTSRAVISTVQDALRYFDEHRALLLGTGAHE